MANGIVTTPTDRRGRALPSNFQDLTGTRFGFWIVLGRVRPQRWHCRCDCGREKVVTASSLREGRSTSCGCQKAKWRLGQYDFAGKVFGRLTITRHVSGEGTAGRWAYVCSCGKEGATTVASLKYNRIQSCGCIAHEKHRTHGATVGPRGSRCRVAEYKVWASMKTRCLNKNDAGYRRYGARGIGVCDGWRDSYESFIVDLGPRPSPAHSLERIENREGYNCGHCADCLSRGVEANCRWATRKEQARNTAWNHYLTYNGVTLAACAWAEQVGIGAGVILARIRNGWTVERALTTPVASRVNPLSEQDRPTVAAKSKMPEYRIWHHMIGRCHRKTDKAYPMYGGRGIKVCRRWRRSFEAFLADVGLRPTPKHSLDRKHNDRGYSKGNCRWADRFTQANNTRRNRMLTHDGRTQSMSEWAREVGINVRLIGLRIDVRGWSVEKALTTPPRRSKNPG